MGGLDDGLINRTDEPPAGDYTFEEKKLYAEENTKQTNAAARWNAIGTMFITFCIAAVIIVALVVFFG